MVVDGINFCTKSKGYWATAHNKLYLHRYIWEKHNGCKIPKGYVVHHKDEDTENNEPSNLILMTRAEHIALHHKGMIHSDEVRAKMSLAKKGKISSFKGKKHTVEAIEKNRQAHLGNVAWNKIDATQEMIDDAKILSNRKWSVKYGYSNTLWKRLRSAV